MLELYILFAFILCAALVAVEVNDMLSSAIAVGAMGLGLSFMFLILKAPEVAITQMIVEILCLVILIRLTLKKDLPFSTSGRWFVNTVITAAFIVVFLMSANKALADLPAFGHPLMRVSGSYLRSALADTGATNLVAAIILDYRVYDTLGEATALFAGVIGVMALVRRRGKVVKGESTGGDHHAQ